MNTKKYIIRAFIAIGAVLILLVLCSVILWIISETTSSAPEFDYYFYEPNYELDVSDFPEYLQKNRNIKYTDETLQQIEINSENYENRGETGRFFYKYFKAIEEGDHETFNSLHEKKLLRKRGKKKEFTKQMIYDIELSFMSETKIDDETEAVQYSLKYCIYRNDGTFRDDMGSDMSRKQYITVYYNLKTDDAKIHNIQTEYTVNK
ncbi:MAG: hypothetical protein IKU52_00420 [Clostridia bacterium]|nr:hypothetical protein [Clostridia bacterium]